MDGGRASVGFLALDRDGDGRIDHPGELFGQTVLGRRRPEGSANSFADLAAFDRPEHGGNGDGIISAADAVFARLRLWVDRNHDGVSQPGELLTLAQAGIESIETDGAADRPARRLRQRLPVPGDRVGRVPGGSRIAARRHRPRAWRGPARAGWGRSPLGWSVSAPG